MDVEELREGSDQKYQADYPPAKAIRPQQHILQHIFLAHGQLIRCGGSLLNRVIYIRKLAQHAEISRDCPIVIFYRSFTIHYHY
jgi:hypothetical protein